MAPKPRTQSKKGEEFNSDACELMAYDLEMRQTLRYRNSKFKDTFFDRKIEQVIHEQIKVFRRLSETYHPDNER